jgi:pimeloyl-ACP methyl ester carboxylesterase
MPREGYPLVILNHGYYKDPKEYKALKSYIPCESFFAEHGYVVVKPDYRGHGDSDGPAYPNGYAPGTIADMLNLIASMKKDERVNAKRIYTIGHSIGGLFSLQCAEISPDIKAVVDYAGSPADPRLRHMLRPKASEEVPSFDFQFEQIRSHVKALRVPVQIHNGTADNAMPFQFSENFYELLKSSGKKDVEFFAYQGGGHHLQGADQELLFERALALFENKPRPRAPQMGQGQLMPNMPGQMQSRRPGMGGGGTLPPGMGGGRGMMPGMGGGPLPGMGGGGGGPFPGMGPVPGMGGPYTPFPPGGFYPRPIYPYPPNRFPPG